MTNRIQSIAPTPANQAAVPLPLGKVPTGVPSPEGLANIYALASQRAQVTLEGRKWRELLARLLGEQP